MSFITVYRKATNHATSKGDIVMRTSTTGVIWSAASTVYSDLTYDARDPGITKLADGALIVSFFLYDHVGGANIAQGVYVIKSVDNGASWGAAAAIGDTFTAESACCAPVIQLGAGTLLLPFYGKDIGETYRSIRLMTSANGGANWAGEVTIANGQTASQDYSEPNLVLLSGGNILCMIRMDTGTDMIYRSISTDNGVTWGAVASCFVGSGAPHTIQLASGTLIICYRSNTNARAVLRTSDDVGVTWSDEFVIDSTSYVGMMYASPIEPSAAVVSIAYSVEAYSEAYVLYKSFAESALP